MIAFAKPGRLPRLRIFIDRLRSAVGLAVLACAAVVFLAATIVSAVVLVVGVAICLLAFAIGCLPAVALFVIAMLVDPDAAGPVVDAYRDSQRPLTPSGSEGEDGEIPKPSKGTTP